MAKARKEIGAQLAPFAGFPKQGISWFHGLSLSQSRDWFQAHKEDYETLWRGPMTALLEELRAPLAKIYGRKLGAAKVFRLNRDLRFAKDKSPYKTHCAGMIPFSSSSTALGGIALYVHLGLDEGAAAGFYSLEPDQLAILRKQVLAEKTGAKLAAMVDAAKAAGHSLTSVGELKRAPSGVPVDHPRVEILRHKGLALSFGKIPKGVRHTAGLKDWLLEQAEVAAPTMRWGLAQKIG